MKLEIISRIEALSKTTRSKKRMVLLLLTEEFDNYSDLTSVMKIRHKIDISSSEFYTHMRALEKVGMIFITYNNPNNKRSWRKFFLTKKGKKLIGIVKGADLN